MFVIEINIFRILVTYSCIRLLILIYIIINFEYGLSRHVSASRGNRSTYNYLWGVMIV